MKNRNKILFVMFLLMFVSGVKANCSYVYDYGDDREYCVNNFENMPDGESINDWSGDYESL